MSRALGLLATLSAAPALPAEAYSITTAECSLHGLRLGQLEFVFDSDSGFTPSEQEEIFKHLQSAFQKLSGFLGEENMYNAPVLRVPIQKMNEGPEGMVHLGDVTLENNKVTMVTFNETMPKMFLKSLEEPNIAHEMTHLMLGVLDTQAYHEGLVYAITKVLYPDYYEQAKNSYAVEACLDGSLFAKGLDEPLIAPRLHRTSMSLDIMFKFMFLWAEFMQENPLFVRTFLTSIREYHHAGQWYFDRALLDQIAEEAQPGFNRWLRLHSPAMLPLERGERFGIVPLDKETILFSNFGVSSDGAVSFITPYVTFPDGYRLETSEPAHIMMGPGTERMIAWGETLVDAEGLYVPVLPCGYR